MLKSCHVKRKFLIGEKEIRKKLIFFQANLRVGDMILAVNTESFLTITYEEVNFSNILQF